MTTFPNSPRLLKGGIVVVDAESGAIQRVIALQYNPDTLSRTLQPKSAGADSPDRAEALRLKGPAVETFKLEVEIDAADMLERGDSSAAEVGIQPSLTVLEALISPTSAQLNDAESAGAQRHAGDRSGDGAADAVRLEQEPRRARQDHRVHDQRGSVRPGPESRFARR